MKPLQEEVWLADLNPTKGSEQAGVRPVIIFQNNTISKFSSTVLTIPLTANLKRSSLPTTIKINKGEGGIDKTRLLRKLGNLSSGVLISIEACIIFTTGITE